MPKLLVLVPDRISDILVKGEYQPAYYNPGGVFDEVHILMTNDDRPDLAALQRTVGKASLHVHNYPDDGSLATRYFGCLTPRRLHRWARGGVEIVRQIAPDMIRCHGADWNTYLASRIKAELGIPYVTSLHINPDINPVRRLRQPRTAAERRHNAFYAYLEKEALCHADLVMPVYQPILPYLHRLGVNRAEVCYNILNGDSLRQKTDYALHDAPHLLYVGRLFDEKDPSNIIRAVSRLDGVRYTIVGDGPARARLEALVAELNLCDRVSFRPAVPNDDLCGMLVDADIFVVHTEYWEISKSVLEAVLTGLPVIINRRIGEPVPEFESGGFVYLVKNTPEDYFAAIHQLLTDHAARAALGRRAYAHGQANWAPAITEAKVVGIYREILSRQGVAMTERAA